MGKSVSQVDKEIVDIFLDFQRTTFNKVLTSSSKRFAVTNVEKVMMKLIIQTQGLNQQIIDTFAISVAGKVVLVPPIQITKVPIFTHPVVNTQKAYNQEKTVRLFFLKR